MCNLLFGIVDVFSFILIVLPLYPNPVDGYIYSVNLLSYNQITKLNLMVYWTEFILLIVVGIIKILLTQLKIEKWQKPVTVISMGLGILTVLFLAMAGEPYAITMVFLLLIVKAVLIYRMNG